jgi:hypothetical protein
VNYQKIIKVYSNAIRASRCCHALRNFVAIVCPMISENQQVEASTKKDVNQKEVAEMVDSFDRR